MVDSIHGKKGPAPLEPLKPNTRTAPKGKAGEGADFAATLKQLDKAAAPVTAQPPVRTAPVNGVVFSPVLHDVTKAAGEVDMERADKIASLKQQIAEGNYQPDLKKVAASLLHFISQRS